MMTDIFNITKFKKDFTGNKYRIRYKKSITFYGNMID